MAGKRKTNAVVCQNPDCEYYNTRRGSRIIRSGRYGTGRQRYYCHHCGTYFMETKGTPFYRKNLSDRDIASICKHLIMDQGIRSIERITGHHRDTIGRLMENMAAHAEEMNTYLVRRLGFIPSECERLWLAIRRKKRKLSTAAQESLERVLAGRGKAPADAGIQRG